MNHTLTNDLVTRVVVDYKEEPSFGNLVELLRVFRKMADALLSRFKVDYISSHELVNFAFDRIARYPAAQNKAFNYFTTVMLGHIRQCRPTHRVYWRTLFTKG